MARFFTYRPRAAAWLRRAARPTITRIKVTEISMAAPVVKCAKLGKELPGIDPSTPEGSQALRMALLLGGREMQQRIRETISAQAWSQWKDHMLMVMNEYRLDPTSEEANKVLRAHMESFLFGETPEIPNYVPPKV